MIDAIIEDIAAAVPGEAPGDYTGPDGLLYCGKCRTPKQSRVTILGAERIMPCICRCEIEARRRAVPPLAAGRSHKGIAAGGIPGFAALRLAL